MHEAGDDSKAETFDGFPWVLRLRYVMENAANLTEVPPSPLSPPSPTGPAAYLGPHPFLLICHAMSLPFIVARAAVHDPLSHP